MRPIKSILVPIDFSEGSTAALATARALGEKLGAELELLHVWEGDERSMPTLVVDIENGTAARLLSEYRAHGVAMERATAVLVNIAADGLRFRARFESGSPAETIARVASEAGHDMVVMGTHGRRGLRRMMLGSVAEAVVRTCPVPVLTVHAEEKAAALRAS